MTKFLFTTLPTNDLGLLTRSLPIARELAATVKRVLAAPTFADNAKKIGERMRVYGGATRAVSLIEQYSEKTSVRIKMNTQNRP